MLYSYPSDKPDTEQLVSVTKMVTQLFEHWNISDKEQCELLGDVSKAQLHKFKNGQSHIKGRDAIERVANLLGIHKSLRLLFPHPSNRKLVYCWIKSRNERLQGLTPLQIMLDKGYRGIEQIRLLTDYLRGQ